MRTALSRRVLGAAAVAALACAASTSTGAAPLPAESYAKAVEADIAHLGTLLDLQKASPSNKSLAGMMKGTAMLIAMYAQDNLDGSDGAKMAALRAAALKVAEAVAKKDMDGAAKAIAGLKAVAADPKADKKPMKLYAMHKIDLHDIMNLYGKPKTGGMNMQDDIRAMKKEGVKDVKLAEIIGVRSTAIAEYSMDLPPTFGGKKTKAAWEGWIKDMKGKAIELTEEAAKGSKADSAKLKKTVSALEASCVNCHNVFRDD